MLAQDNEILVSQSLSVDKSHLTVRVLIDALFYDLETADDFQIPTQPQRRERALHDLLEKRRKPIALFIDDAHGMRDKTLVELKRLLEAVREEGGTLSAVLAGQPNLKNVLQSPALEAIGSPAVVFDPGGFRRRDTSLSPVATHPMCEFADQDRHHIDAGGDGLSQR
jgi:type II secretory pathway predicted ATPase ExeA